jgi:hypothetical protein
MAFVFSVEMANPFSFAHLDTVFVVFCSRAFAVIGVLLLVRITQSLANILVGPSIPLHISAIATKNRVMLSTAPCTTPFLISLGVAYVLPMATYSVRFVMNEWVKFSIFPSIFQSFNFLKIFSLQHMPLICRVILMQYIPSSDEPFYPD